MTQESRIWTHRLTPGLISALIKAIHFVHAHNRNEFHLQRDLDFTHSEFTNFQKIKALGARSPDRRKARVLVHHPGGGDVLARRSRHAGMGTDAGQPPYRQIDGTRPDLTLPREDTGVSKRMDGGGAKSPITPIIVDLNSYSSLRLILFRVKVLRFPGDELHLSETNHIFEVFPNSH
jgi:hypothetical protein